MIHQECTHMFLDQGVLRLRYIVTMVVSQELKETMNLMHIGYRQ